MPVGRVSDGNATRFEGGAMAFWLVVSIYCTICAIFALSLWNGTRRAGMVPVMRIVVFFSIVLLLSVQLFDVVSQSSPQVLERYGIQGGVKRSILAAITLLAMLMLIPGLWVLSSAARRTQKYHNASSAIPSVMHRITNLEMINQLMMDCSLGATFVLTRTPATRGTHASFNLVVGNRGLRRLLHVEPSDGHPSGSLGPRDPDGISWWIEEVASKALTSNAPVRSERAFVVQGQTRWYLLSTMGRGAYVAGVIMETTQKRRESTERAISANTDPLTKLSNRGHLTSIINTEAHRTSHGVSRGFVVYFFDFDGFKNINDTLGHHVGDELLKQIASRLRETFRGVQLPINASRPCIARYGGDEYVVVVPGLTRRDEVEALAEAFLVQLREPYSILGHDVTSTASVGGAICAGQAAQGKDVLTAADAAMYRAKQSGKDRFCLHEGGYDVEPEAA